MALHGLVALVLPLLPNVGRTEPSPQEEAGNRCAAGSGERGRHLIRARVCRGPATTWLQPFLWDVFVTTLPLILAMYVGKYLFRIDGAILRKCCSGARTTTAALGMINDIASSQIPGLGYTVTYAVGNTLLTIWGMVLVILLT
jgi:hypothetical protein